MACWTIDYSNTKLPSRIIMDGWDYSLIRTSGIYPYILRYERTSEISDSLQVALQSFGQTEEEAVDNMVLLLREHNINLQTGKKNFIVKKHITVLQD